MADVGTLVKVVSGNGATEGQFGVGLRKSGSHGIGGCRSRQLIPETLFCREAVDGVCRLKGPVGHWVQEVLLHLSWERLQ